MSLTAEAPQGLRDRTRNAVFWSLVERWGTRLATLGSFLVLARLLEPEDFGVLAAATIALGIGGLLVDAGFGKYLVQAREVRPVDASTVFWLSLASGVAVATLLVLAAPLLASAFGSSQVRPVLLVLSGTVVINALGVVPASLMQRDLDFRPLALRRIWATAAGAATAVALAVGGAGVWALVGQAIAVSVVQTVVLWRATPWRPSRQVSRDSARRATGFGGNLLGIEALSMVGRNGDNILIGIVLGPVALGYYVVGYRILLILLEVLTSVIGSVSLPLFAKLRDDPARRQRVFLTTVRTGALVAFPVFALLALVAPYLLPLAFGQEWEPSTGVMQWLAVAGLIQCMTYFDRPLLIASDRVRLELVVTSLATVGNLVAFTVSVRHGIVAVAFSYAVRNLLFWPVRLWALRRAGVVLVDYARALAPASTAAAVAVALAALVLLLTGSASPWGDLLLGTGVTAVAYLGVLRMLFPVVLRDSRGLLR